MALNVQFIKYLNQLINEEIVVPRLVNQQSLDFNELCEYLADGSTVTPADVAAVMKQIEMRLPLVLGLNAKVVCSPEGLTFRPKVSGSLTQSQLKAKLEAKLAADPTADIDVNRALTISDLTTGDLTAEIAIDLPKKWNERFQTKATFKRITKDGQESSSEGSGGNDNQSGNNGQQAVSAPTISGTTPFSDSTQMTISGPTGATIYYTTDGSTPTSSSTQYSSAVTLSATTTVKAIAIKDGVSSSVATKVFTKSEGGGGNSGDGDDGME